MKLSLTFIRETPLARLYRRADGTEQWIPRSVCRKTLKWPSDHGLPPVHEVEIADWWLMKNRETGGTPVPLKTGSAGRLALPIKL